jgi:hypothetical protein
VAGLIDIIDAYQNGVSRTRQRAKETADSQEKQDEYIAQHAPYKQGKRDQFGYATGMESNPAVRKQDMDYFGLEKPAEEPASQTDPAKQLAMAAPQPAPPPPPPVQEPSVTPSGRPLGKTEADYAADEQGNSAPQGQPAAAPAPSPSTAGKAEQGPGDPRPLLRDPKAALQVADSLVPRPDGQGKVQEQTLPSGNKAELGAGTKSVEYDPSEGKPQLGPDGKTRNVVPAKKTTQEFDQDLNVTGAMTPPPVAPPAPAAQPPAPHKPGLEPSDYAMKRLVDLQTTLPRSGAGMPIDVNSLPPDVQQALGVTDEMLKAHVKIPASIVNSLMGNSTKIQVQQLKNEGQTVDAKFQPVLDALQAKELPLGSAIAMATRLNGGVRPPQAVLKAMQGAGTLGNADRTFGLANDKFGQSKNDKTAAVSGDYAKRALNETKLDLEAVTTADTVDRMLQRKDTNGLRKLVPIIIERSFVPQRLTNQMIQSDTGLMSVSDKLEQIVTGLDSGEITPDNIAFFRSLLAEAKKEHLDNITQKNYRWKRAGAGALMAKGLEEGEALETMDRALSGNLQGGSAGAGGAYPNPSAPKPNMTPGAQPKGEAFKATKNELGFRKEMMQATQALRQAGDDPAKQKLIKSMFEKRTGIKWGAGQ